jgi:benzoyl-CoA reductase/2-hydroxyglutaryl-CoA dehydratase subunit BcrC/BadD/HgdB
MLILDGDAVYRRNSPDGQIRTRFEAFMEVLRQEDAKGGA